MSFDYLEQFSWWSYVLTAIIYTALTFYGEAPKTRAWIFSRQNTAPVSRIAAVHVGFLVLLFALMRFIPSIFPFMPGWVTEIGSRGSTVDILFVVAALLMHKIERRMIYLESPENDLFHG